MQINKISVWKIEDTSQELLTKPSEAIEPSLQCEVDHFGDVMELQVCRLYCISVMLNFILCTYIKESYLVIMKMMFC